jgi:heme A synthase
VTSIHRYTAYVVVAGWAALALWALVSFLLNKAPGDAFWNLLAAMQVLVGVQVVVGGVLFVFGSRPATPGPSWLHYAYGGLFPLAVLVFAHRYARRNQSVSWMVFGVAAFVIFGLTLRALQTGLGVA